MGLAGTLLVEQRKHPQLLGQFRDGMLVPLRDEVAAALERGKARGEVRADLDLQLAAHAILGSFVYQQLVAGRPGPRLGRGRGRHPLAGVRRAYREGGSV